MVEISRRAFIKQASATVLALTLPALFAAPAVIADVQLIDGWWEGCVELGQIENRDKTSIGIECALDTDRVWSFIRLVDEDGRTWITPDGGKTWQHGLMQFRASD